jgi:hypothetical protein
MRQKYQKLKFMKILFKLLALPFIIVWKVLLFIGSNRSAIGCANESLKEVRKKIGPTPGW